MAEKAPAEDMIEIVQSSPDQHQCKTNSLNDLLENHETVPTDQIEPLTIYDKYPEPVLADTRKQEGETPDVSRCTEPTVSGPNSTLQETIKTVEQVSAQNQVEHARETYGRNNQTIDIESLAAEAPEVVRPKEPYSRERDAGEIELQGSSNRIQDIREYLQEMQGERNAASGMFSLSQRESTEELSELHINEKDVATIQFNIFLVKLNKKLSTDDLKTMKDICRKYIPNGRLEKVKVPMEIFTILQKSGYLSKDNVMLLQVLLHTLDDPDLLEMAINYARFTDNTLYFHEAPEEPEDGYRFARFHLKGRDFTKVKRADIDRWRIHLSRLLFIPIDQILIAGIEPSSSIFVTLMLPNMYVESLWRILKEGKHGGLPYLQDEGINSIEIDGERFNISGGLEFDKVDNEQHNEFVNVYKQLKKALRQRDAADEDCISKQQKLDQMQERISQLEDEMTLEQRQICKIISEACNKLPGNGNGQSIPSVPSTVFDEFEKVMQEMERRGYDKPLILHLLKLNTELLATCFKVCHEANLQQLIGQRNEFAAESINLRTELIKHLSMSHPEADVDNRLFLDVLQKVILSELNKDLTDKDRLKIEERHAQRLTEEDRRALQKQETNVMTVVCMRMQLDIERRFDFDSFVTDVLMAIDRNDLIGKFEDMLDPSTNIHKRVMEDTTKLLQREGGQQGVVIQVQTQVRQNGQTNGKTEQQLSSSTSQPKADPTAEADSSVQTKILEKVRNIHACMQQTQTLFAADFAEKSIDALFKPFSQFAAKKS